jgi:hypothetical protein
VFIVGMNFLDEGHALHGLSKLESGRRFESISAHLKLKCKTFVQD